MKEVLANDIRKQKQEADAESLCIYTAVTAVQQKHCRHNINGKEHELMCGYTMRLNKYFSHCGQAGYLCLISRRLAQRVRN